MLFTGGLLGVLGLLFTAYCVLDAATSQPQDVRGLPKALWFPVLLVPVVGGVLWFLLGRPRPGAGRALPQVLPDAAPPSRTPDDDEAFLRELRRRAEEQRRTAEEARRAAEERRRARGADGEPGDRPA